MGKDIFYYVLFFTFFILNLFSYVLDFPFKMLPRGFSSIVTMKVLCIALLLIGWSSAQAKKLDEKELERHCSRRDIAYVKEQVAEFGNKTVVEAKEKPYGDSCLMNVVYWGQRDRYWGQETCKKKP